MARHVSKYHSTPTKKRSRALGSASIKTAHRMFKAARHVGNTIGVYTKGRQLFKRGGSSTATATKVKEKNAPADSHSGVGLDTIRVGNWKPAKLLKRQFTKGAWKYQQDYRAMLNGQSGAQTCTNIVYPMSLSKLLVSTGSSYGIIDNDVALEQLNPYLNTVGSTYLPQTLPLNDRFIVKNCTLELEMTSLSAVGCYLDVYVVQCKKACKQDPLYMWNQGLGIQSEGQSVFVNPPIGVGPFAPGYPTKDIPHAKPGESKLFSQYYRILKVRSFQFTGNSSMRFNIDIGINKVIKMETVRQYVTDGITHQPGSFAIFTVQRGSVVEDTTPSGPYNGLPTYGTTKIGYVLQERYNMCGVMGNTGRLNVSTVVDTLPNGQTLANQSLLNEVDVSALLSNSSVL